MENRISPSLITSLLTVYSLVKYFPVKLKWKEEGNRFIVEALWLIHGCEITGVEVEAEAMTAL